MFTLRDHWNKSKGNICDLLIRQKHFLPKNTILNICGPKKHFFASVSSIYLRYGPGFAEGPPVTWPASCQLTWHVQVQGSRGRGRKSWRKGVGRGVGEGGELESRADRRGRWLKNTSNWKIIFAMMCTSRKENYSENQFVSYKKFGKSFCLALSFTDSLTHSCLCSTKPVKSLSAPLFGISCLYCQSSLSSVVFVVSCLCYQLSLSQPEL